MKVKDLKKLLNEYPDNAEVLIMKDWDNCPVSEDGMDAKGKYVRCEAYFEK